MGSPHSSYCTCTMRIKTYWIHWTLILTCIFALYDVVLRLIQKRDFLWNFQKCDISKARQQVNHKCDFSMYQSAIFTCTSFVSQIINYNLLPPCSKYIYDKIIKILPKNIIHVYNMILKRFLKIIIRFYKICYMKVTLSDKSHTLW